MLVTKRPSILWVIALLVVMAIPALSADLSLSGYLQTGLTTTNPAVSVNRAFVNLGIDVDENVSAALLFQGGTDETVLDEAYIAYQLTPDLVGRLGLVRTPFGYEMPLSASKLTTIGRSLATNQLIIDDLDLQYDEGVYAYYTPDGKPYTLTLALANDPAGADAKNVVGRITYDLPAVAIGFSAMRGSGVAPSTRVGVDAQCAIQNISLLAEVITRDRITAGVARPIGGYVTAAYQMEDSALQPYVRLDTLNGLGAADNTVATLGVNYFMGEDTRLTLEASLPDKGNNAIAAQAQVTF